MKRPKISRRAETRPYGRVSAPTGNCRKFLTQLAPVDPDVVPAGRRQQSWLRRIRLSGSGAASSRRSWVSPTGTTGSGSGGGAC